MKNIFERFGITISRLLPSKIKATFKSLIGYSGKKHSVESVLGVTLLVGLIIFIGGLVASNLIVYEQTYLTVEDAMAQNPDFDPDFDTMMVDGELVSNVATGMSEENFKLVVILSGLALSFFPLFGIYIYYFFLAEKRTKYVEKVLPDALSLISSNMNSGLTAYHAVKSAIRTDFGPLAEAFEVATNKSISKKSFKDSLLEISDDIKSDSLQRSMKLFATAMESGSNVSSLLKNLSKDITERQALKNDLVTSTMQNSMFIMFMVVVGGPMLMAVSIFFVEIVSGILAKAGSSSGDSAGLGMSGEITISPEFLTMYAYIFFFITGFLVAYFTGTMIEGDGKTGLKKAPIIILLSYVVFFIAQNMIRAMLGGMF